MQQNYRGIYDSTQSYSQYDVVSFTQTGTTDYYLCLTSNSSASPQSPIIGTDSQYWGLINTLSNFPNEVDSFLNHTMIQASDQTNIQTYQSLLLTTNPTPAQQDQINSLTQQLRDKLILPDDWNALQQSISNMQQFFLSNVNGFINQMQATMQAKINQFQNMGAYSTSATYMKNNFVTYLNQTYICTADNTIDIDPTNTSNWQLAAKQGAQGERGIPGANLVFKGAYNSTITYSVNDAVQYNGSVYYCTQSVMGETPSANGVSWELFISKSTILVLPSTPSSPSDGDTWINSTDNNFYRYNGSTASWIQVSQPITITSGTGISVSSTANGYKVTNNGVTSVNGKSGDVTVQGYNPLTSPSAWIG